MTEDEELKAELATLIEEHRDLDTAINALVEARVHDQLKIRRLKKRKLILKDEIQAVEDQLIPDLIA